MFHCKLDTSDIMEVDQICLGYEPEGRQRHIYIYNTQIIDLRYMPKRNLTQLKDKIFPLHTAKAYMEAGV